MTNKLRFGMGVGMISIEVIGLIMFGLTKLSWAWVNEKTFVIIAIVLYNLLAIIFAWNGSKKSEDESE